MVLVECLFGGQGWLGGVGLGQGVRLGERVW